jgi:hypothetical protein
MFRIISSKLDTHYHLFLLLSILFTLIFYPFFPEGQNRRLIFHLLLSFIIVVGIFAIGYKRNSLYIAVFFLILTLILNFWDFYASSRTSIFVINICFLPYFLFITYKLVFYVVRKEAVSANTIYGAIAGYLLIGIVGALIFSMVEVFYPKSFHFTHDEGREFHDFLYYSFVTLSTVGYGDVTPVNSKAQSFSVLLSIAGQFYLTILVAILVGKYLNRDSN